MPRGTVDLGKLRKLLSVSVMAFLIGALLATPQKQACFLVSATTNLSATGLKSYPSTLASQPFCTPERLTLAKSLVRENLKNRVNALDQLAADVSGNEHLDDVSKSTLMKRLTLEKRGISSLLKELPTAQTCGSVVQIAHSVVYGFRVYVVTAVEVHLVSAAEKEFYVYAKLVGLKQDIQAVINALKAKGSSRITRVESSYSSHQDSSSQVNSLIANLSSEILSRSPRMYPGDKIIFESAQKSLISSRLKECSCIEDLQGILHLIK